jgi:S1-C subfamily serine protease
MRLKHALCIAFVTSTAIALAQAQTTKQTPHTKASAPAAQKKPLQQLPFTDARNMTVILVYAPPGTMPKPFGSGFWIGEHGYIVTCWHVISQSPDLFKIGIARDPYVTEGKINISFTGGASLIDVKLEAHDEDADIAILKAEKAPDQVQLAPTVVFLGAGQPPAPLTPQLPITPKGGTLNTDFPQPGDTLLLAGFPLGENALVLQTGVATGFLSRRRTESSPPSSGLRLMLSMVSNPGNSGGPVLDADGKAIGLLEGALQSPIRDEQNHDLYYARPKLDQNGQPMRDASGQPILEFAPYLQNAGISFAVPSKFITDLAKKSGISLD